MTIAVDLGRKATKQTKQINTDQHLCSSLTGKYSSLTSYMQNFDILASLTGLDKQKHLV